MGQPQVERKLAAIFYADVAGYSRLTGRDEEGTHRTLTAYLDSITETIKRHGGRTVHFAGDAVLADFASVVAALNCAVEVQRELAVRNAELPEDRRLRFRIGINLGEVIVDRGDIYGDGVNVAARLEGLADPGGICISGSVFDQVAGKLDYGFEYLGEQRVKNIEKPIPAYRVLLDPAAAGRVLGRRRRRGSRRLLVAAVLVLALAGTAAWGIYRYLAAPDMEPASPEKMAFPLPEKPSIAVLPFANLSGDPEQEYFADGLTDDLITDLSKISGLFVIARNSVFAYKGRPVKVQRVAEELGVRYVLEGSVRRAGNRVRINAQLIDATTGRHVWAERFDRELKDIFAVQDEVIGKIVSMLEVELTERDREARAAARGTDDLEAYDQFLRGMELRSRFTWKDTLAARDMFLKAVELDPRFARAYVALGNLSFEAWRIWGEPRETNLEKAIEYARRAAAIDDRQAEVHVLLALSYHFLGRSEQAETEAQKALALGIGDADALASLGDYLRLTGRPREAIELFRQSMRLNPYFPAWQLAWLGHAYFMTGQYDRAIETLKRGIRRDATYIAFHLFLAASYAASGREAEAKAAAKEVLKLNPNFTLSAYAGFIGHRDKADLDRDLLWMRAAGLPE